MSADRRRYRHDVDGLRGVAIALVVVHHVWGNRVSGGVDVFLTLSGFFLTLTILRRYDGWRPDRPVPLLREILASWRRIARRLLPAALATLAGTTVAVVLLLPTVRWGQVATEMLASAFYVENWYLALTGSQYEAAGREVSPVQHFWSLSVQGQLFLLVPAVVLGLLWAARRTDLPVRPRHLLAGLFAAATAVSFGYAVLSVRTDQPFAYYDTLARAWQPLSGGLLALSLHRLTPLVGRLQGSTAGRVAVGVLAWTALAAILTGALVLDGGATFPGVAALCPVLAALTLVVAGAGPAAPLPHRLLALPAARWLGHRAYGLYLWHWPLLVLSLAVTGRERAGVADGLVVVATALALAALTHTYVEQPLREGSSPKARQPRTMRRVRRGSLSIAAASVTLGVVLPSVWLTSLEYRARHIDDAAADTVRYPGAADLSGETAPPPAPVLPPPDLAKGDHHRVKDDGCVVESQDPGSRSCLYGDVDATRTVAVVGASHMLNFLPALDLVGQQRGFAIRTHLRAGCPWTSSHLSLTREAAEICESWAEDVTDLLVTEPPALVLTVGTRPQPDGRGDHVPQNYPRHWHEVVEAGVPLVAFRLNPWYPEPPVSCLVEALEHGEPVDSCRVHRDEVLSEDFLAGSPDLPPMGWIDLSDQFCRPTSCHVVEGNVLLYRNEDHITATYSRTMATALDPALGRVTGWWG